MTILSTLPFSWYTSEEQLRRERTKIFARSWQDAGRERGRRPTRSRPPHHRRRRHSRPRHPRRRRSCARSSTSAGIAAPCWRGLRSELDPVSLPRVDLRPRRSLRPLRDRTRGPAGPERLVASSRRASPPGADILFVNPDPQARPLVEQLGALPEILARDIAVDDLVFHSRVKFDAAANWKVVAELPRVLPLRDRASCVQRSGRRASRPLRARSAPDLRGPVLQVAGQCRARPVPPALPEHRHQRTRARPTCRSARYRRRDQSRSCSSTTSSARDVGRAMARQEFFAFDDQVGRRKPRAGRVGAAWCRRPARPRQLAARGGASAGCVSELGSRTGRLEADAQGTPASSSPPPAHSARGARRASAKSSARRP